MDAPRPPSEPGLLGEILGAPDREWLPGARPLVSAAEDDEPAFRAALAQRQHARFALRRRGVEHGDAVELEGPVPPLPTTAALRRRWEAAQPILVPNLALRGLEGYRAELEASLALADELRRPGGLGRWLRSCAPALPAELVVSPRRARPTDRERDLEKVVLAPADARHPGAPRPLWVKSARLSTHTADASLRVRVGFGQEGADDASRDLARHHLVADVGAALFPEARLAADDNRLLNLLEALVGEPTFLTQHIAYWNAPEGGALFHHDAFAGDEDGGGQLGVCFVQLVGRTLWLALPIEDLAARVREFAAYLSEGELPWVVAELFPRAADLDAFLRRVNDHARLLRELALPGCGALGPLVNRGPEFSALLLDAGHGVVLEPGDALLLPNHGYRRTCMHSVFTASSALTFGISMAVRAIAPRPEPTAPPDSPSPAAIPREARRRSPRPDA